MEPAMGVNISIKNVPEEELEKLRQRARSNHRSLQGELRTILSEAATQASRQRKLTLDEFVSEIEKIGLKTPSESVQMIREDRDR
jgi:plasmid stability protein